MAHLLAHLRDIYELDDFRPAQRDVIEDTLAGRDVLCVMPTGAGKSLCFQFPSTFSGGLTLVVSPLISLMQDQVRRLRDAGIAATLINSTLTASMQRQVMDEVENGFAGLLYVAPERFWSGGFLERIRRQKIKLLAVDEAHCISMWGHDFRPEYGRLGEVRQQLGNPPTLPLTATATDYVRQDILRLLGLRQPRVYITGFDRPNLRYESRIYRDEPEKMAALATLLKELKGSGIVYCATRRAVDELAILLSPRLKGRALFGYHAGMELDQRRKTQDQFMDSEDGIAIATNAFGMGINKPDIRFVIHYHLTGTLEQYYQEAGRAGRDGLESRCILLYDPEDRGIQEHFISLIGDMDAKRAARLGLSQQPGRMLTPEEIERIEVLKQHARVKLGQMIDYAELRHCRRQAILDYFGDRTRVDGCGCDVCQASSRAGPGGTIAGVSEEVEQAVRKILSAVARVSLKGSFGVTLTAEVLVGETSERVIRWQFEDLSVFGLLSDYSLKKVVGMIYRLVEAGLIRDRDVGSGSQSIPVIELTGPGVSVMKGQRAVPPMLHDLLGRKRKKRKREK